MISEVPIERPSFIDLFAGCGGISLGLMKAGWHGILAIEKGEDAFATLKYNLLNPDSSKHPCFSWPAWLNQEPISVNSFSRKYAHEVKTKLYGQIDLVAGGPPCQGFSFAGKREPNDSRNSSWLSYFHVVDLIEPTLVLLENVEGIAVEHGRRKRLNSGPLPGRPREAFSARIARALQKRKYTVYSRRLRAVDYGVPQRRPRYFMIGIKEKNTLRQTDPFLLLEQVRQSFLVKKGLNPKKHTTVGEAISDLLKSNGTYRDSESPRFLKGFSSTPRTAYQCLMTEHNGKKRLPDSHRFANHTPTISDRFSRMLRECPRGVSLSEKTLIGFGTKKHAFTIADAEKPAHTLTTLPDDLLHYSEPRILTAREYARLQSFPDCFIFKGRYTTGGRRRTKETPRYTQIGNAVPPLLAESLGVVLLEYTSHAHILNKSIEALNEIRESTT